MDGKVVLITGAQGGLGTYVTDAFLAEGATVIGVSRSIRDTGRITALAAELNSEAAARDIVDRALERHGHVDALVHLMGGFAGGQTVAGTPTETLSRMLDVNLMSTFHITRAVLPHMQQQGHGRLVAMGSRAAIEANACAGAYSASKAAVIALMRAIDLENRSFDITANVLSPGTIDTPANRAAMPDADRSDWVQPEDLASQIVSFVRS